MIWIILLSVLLGIAGLTAAVNAALAALQLKYIKKNVQPVCRQNPISPEVSAQTGAITFVTDHAMKVMQLTDIHIGAGWLSFRKDRMALDTVAAMMKAEQPDLVIVTGDIAYPVPFQSGTFNNKTAAKIFGCLMDRLGVYWVPVLGNHDTEAYAYYSRRAIGKYYEQHRFLPKKQGASACLFQCGCADIDGVGNYVINIQNTDGQITQSLFLMDTGSYVDNDYLGMLWKYDGIHQNQLEWYKSQLRAFEAYNGARHARMPKSLLFFHIPIAQYRDAWALYKENGFKDTDTVQYHYGRVGEKGGIYPSLYPDGVFDAVLELGSTQGLFCGHDHLNNFSLDYKGVRLTYGLSIDYLAYVGIKNYGAQRGCTIIDVRPDGTFDCRQENYYSDKYAHPARNLVTMRPYYPQTAE